MLLAVLTDRIGLSATAAAAAVLGLAGWFFFARVPPPDPRAPRTLYTHAHCTNCNEEFAYEAGLERKACPSCETPESLVPTVGSVTGDTRVPSKTPWGKVFAFAGVCGVVLPGLALTWAWRMRAVRRAAAETRDPRLVWNCPHCGRKISYPASKAGTGVVCPRCKTAFALAAMD